MSLKLEFVKFLTNVAKQVLQSAAVYIFLVTLN